MRFVAVLTAAVLMLSACGADEPAPVALTATDVSSLKVTGQLAQGPAMLAYLSPDGRTLLYIYKNGTCVRGVDGSNEQCFDHVHDPDPNMELDTGSAAWSPDGRKIAMTNLYALGLEPDLWVLDVASGKLTNLTDDGVKAEGMSLNGAHDLPDGARVDLFPSWSADGKWIRFLRKDSAGVAVMAVPAGGGAPKKLGALDTDWDGLQSVAWTENSIGWMSGPSEGGSGAVLVATVSGDDQHKVLDGEYRLLSFSTDGAFLLADQRGPEGTAAVGKARVVPTSGGDPVPVASGGVTYPTWAPKGHAIAYVEGGVVKVVGKPGAAPRILHEDAKLTAADNDNLDWTSGGMLVRVGENNPVVLNIDGW